VQAADQSAVFDLFRELHLVKEKDDARAFVLSG
jgi:hypothetical protein